MSAMPDQLMNPLSLLTSHRAAQLLQVNPSSINNWIREGRLTAFRTPGGHRRIHARNLANFVVKSGMALPEELATVVSPTVIWVDPDEENRNRVVNSLSKMSDEVEWTVASTMMDALMLVGQLQPHFLIIDGRVDDVRREDAVRAVQERFPDVTVAYIDHELTHNEREAAKALQVTALHKRDERPTDVIEGLLEP